MLHLHRQMLDKMTPAERKDWDDKQAKKTGNGVKFKKAPVKSEKDFVQFGPKFVINKAKLKKGTFSVMYPTGAKVFGLRNAQLSPILRDLLLGYLDGEPLDTTGLSEEEQAWFKYAWTTVGLMKKPVKLPVTITKKQAMMNRLKVLMGMVAAGNDSDQIIKEFQQLVIQSDNRGWLTPDQLIKCNAFISGME